MSGASPHQLPVPRPNQPLILQILLCGVLPASHRTCSAEKKIPNINQPQLLQLRGGIWKSKRSLVPDGTRNRARRRRTNMDVDPRRDFLRRRCSGEREGPAGTQAWTGRTIERQSCPTGRHEWIFGEYGEARRCRTSRGSPAIGVTLIHLA